MNKYLKILLAVIISFGFMTNAFAWKISAGTVTMNDPTVTSGFQTVSFTGSFFDVAPVVFVLPRNSETEPRSLRIRAVTTSGFEIVQVRPTVCGGCTDAGNFGTPTISWIAIEPGRHRLPSGDYIQVGTLNTTTSQSKLGGTTGLDTVNFSSAFSSASIAMVGQVQTTNNAVSTTGGTTSPFITTVIQNANASSFQIAMELNEVSTAPPGSAETIGWLAAEDGMTDTLTDTGSGSVLIEAILSGDTITNSCTVDNTFSNTYSSNPLVVASKNRRDGIDGGWTRQCQISTSAVRFKIQEDEGTDTDVNHTTESVGIFVVEGAFDAEVIDPTANPIANWRMDEFSWSGTSGEVSDETGSFDATALNSAQTSDSSPAIAGNPGTCYYGTFPFNNTATPPVAVDSGLNIDTDVGNVGTITMWYFSNADWNVGGDRQLLDAGYNAAAGGPKYFFLTLQNGGNLRFGYEDSADGDWRINSPAQTFVAGEWVHIAVTWDLPNDMQAIFIDGVQVATGTGNTNGVMGELDTLYIGDNNGNYIITGDTTANSANGGIDEVRIYDSALNATDITNIRNETHDCQSDLYFEVASVTLNDTNTTPSFTAVNFRQTYPSAPLVFALPTNTDTDPASLRVRNVTTTGFEIAQVEPQNLDGRQNAMTVDYIAIMPGENTLPDGRAIEAGTHTTQSVQHGSGVPGGETWDTVNFTSTVPFSAPTVLLQIQELANEYNTPPSTTSRPWLTASIQNVGNTSFQTALERSEVNDGIATTISVDETIAYLAINGGVQGSFSAEGKTILYESINSADAIAGWDNENCATNVGESISFVNTYTSTPLAIAHTRRHDGGDGGWIVRCSIDASQIGLAFEEDIFNDAERSHTNEQASILVFSEVFCYPTCVSTTVNHYDIDFSSLTGITCLPVDVTITAKDNTDTTVNHTSLTTIDFNTSTNLGEWGIPSSGTGSFSDPTPGTPDNGDFSYEFPIGESSVTIPLSYNEFAVAGNSETFEIDITTSPDEDGGIADANDDPSVTFEFTTIIFNNVTDTNNTITTQISGKPSNTGFNTKTYNLQVLNADEDDPTVCESLLGSGDVVSIELGAECKNPTACAGRELNIDNINAALPAAGVDIDTSTDDTVATTVSSYEAVDLEFGANAAAEIVLTYPDAGSLELHARYELLLDDGVTGSGEFATGISNAFVVRPFGVVVGVIQDSGAGANPAAVDATGTRFVKAGEDFRTTIAAVNWGTGDDDGSVDATGCDLVVDPGCAADDGIPDTNAVLTDNNGGGALAATPNFQGTGAIDITLSAVAPFSPSAGTLGNLEDSGTLTAPVVTAASFAGGFGTITTIYYDEVGTITMKADGSDYLSTGQAITGRSSNIDLVSNPNNGSVGRFIPDRFLITGNGSPSLLNTCAAGNFTYMDEVFSYNVVPQITVSAVNTYGDPTVNYGDGGTAATDYWKLPTVLDRSFSDNGVNNGSNFISAALATVTVTGDDDFTDGLGVFSLNNTIGDRDTFMFDRSTVDISAAEGAPFIASVDVLIEVDSVTGSLYDTDDVCYDVDDDDTCDDYTALTDTGGTALSLDQLRFGRFTIGTAVGSELLTLSPAVITEYFNGTGFVIHTDDSCTFSGTLELRDHLRLQNGDTGGGSLQLGDATMTIGAGTTSITTFNNPTGAGDTGATFSAPGEDNTGFVNITGNLGCNDATACVGSLIYDHLRYDWVDDDGNNDGPYDDEPSGRIDFGLFKGPDEFIYIREPW